MGTLLPWDKGNIRYCNRIPRPYGCASISEPGNQSYFLVIVFSLNTLTRLLSYLIRKIKYLLSRWVHSFLCNTDTDFFSTEWRVCRVCTRRSLQGSFRCRSNAFAQYSQRSCMCLISILVRFINLQLLCFRSPKQFSDTHTK